MRGIVIHHKGKIWRALEGRVSIGRLAIDAITPVPLKQEGSSRDFSARRPLYYVFTIGGRTIAASKNVTLKKGRRYPHVEHWFVLSEFSQPFELTELQQVSPASLG
jgi:hypothetical protein